MPSVEAVTSATLPPSFPWPDICLVMVTGTPCDTLCSILLPAVASVFIVNKILDPEIKLYTKLTDNTY